MTVIVAMVVNPKNGEKPYVLFGSDSLRVEYDLIDSEPVETGRDENQQKIFIVQNNLISFMGLFDTDISDLLKYLENNTTVETKIEDIVDIAKEFIDRDLAREDSKTKYITVLFGQIDNNGNPVFAYLEFDKARYKDANIEYIKLKESPDFDYIVSGPDNHPKELEDEYVYEIEQNDSIDAVKKSTEQFLKQLASLFPENCNQDIKIKCLV
ncbi:hypothetical protein [Lysinibacillus xylanilyticus]|uniref:hypothetical protein n=1 Tax=Lysinibacillus xylanilyticus TaxID=582475 RepID=UPI003D02687A